MTESSEKRIQQAIVNFKEGYGCCQSVVAAFCDLYGLDRTMALRVSAGFGGGVGRMRLICGAASALVILAGLHQGQTKGDDPAGKAECYKLVQQLLAAFKERNASIICSELLGIAAQKKAAGDTTPEPDERNAEYYKVRPCARMVASSARIFAEFLESQTTK